jgi:hypothetical protein
MAEFGAKHSIINYPVPSVPAFSQIYQRSASLFAGMKGLSATGIHGELVEILGSGAITYSAIIKYLRSASSKVKGAGSDEGRSDPGTNLADDHIFHAFEISPVASMRQTARMTVLPKTTVYRYLPGSLNFVNKRFQWVPHSLSE